MEPGCLLLICTHDQWTTVCKKRSNGFGEVGFLVLLCSPIDKSQVKEEGICSLISSGTTLRLQDSCQIPGFIPIGSFPVGHEKDAFLSIKDMIWRTKPKQTDLDSGQGCIYSNPKSKPLWQRMRRGCRWWGNRYLDQKFPQNILKNSNGSSAERKMHSLKHSNYETIKHLTQEIRIK